MTMSGIFSPRRYWENAMNGSSQQVVDDAKRHPIEFSLFYFSSNADEVGEDKYRLLIEGAKFADTHEFTAVWLPERHFHPFGGLYPNPSVLASALAMVTERVRLRAGSVVLPMHHPVRVAEEWAVVDNLSGGRVDLSLAAGWNPDDFALAPDSFKNRYDLLFSGLDTIRTLWGGGTIALRGGLGQTVQVRVYPQPRQPTLATWITCDGGRERFVQSGERGANVLTALLFQGVAELAEKIAAYREARARHGHDPASGEEEEGRHPGGRGYRPDQDASSSMSLSSVPDSIQRSSSARRVCHAAYATPRTATTPSPMRM